MYTVVIVIVKQVFHRPLTTASVIQHSVSIFFPELASLIIKEGFQVIIYSTALVSLIFWDKLSENVLHKLTAYKIIIHNDAKIMQNTILIGLSKTACNPCKYRIVQ